MSCQRERERKRERDLGTWSGLGRAYVVPWLRQAAGFASQVKATDSTLKMNHKQIFWKMGCLMLSAGGSIFDMLNLDDRASWRAKTSHSLEGIYATVAITVVTFFALFMDDFRLAVLPTQLDVSCEYLSGLILVSLPSPQQE